MKLVKRIFKFIAILIGIVLVAIIIIVFVDKKNTNYLNIENNEFAKSNSYLIINVNVVPMHMDTVLTNKKVYIKDSLIYKIADSIDIKSIEIIDAENKYLAPGLIDMHVHLWDRYELGLYLSNGITSIRNLWGMPMHLRIKDS